ncbi:2OG-Fe(II) oxygenase [Flavobacterium sp. U410]|jgi:PKHD-type hydroxylase
MNILLDNYNQCQLDNWYWFQEAFTEDELLQIEQIQESIPFNMAKIAQDTDDLETKRKSEVKWLGKEVPDFKWLYERFITMGTEANTSLWKFDLTEIVDDLQYTVYHHDGGHFDWHMDLGSEKYARRKVSITMQLSDPEDYEGGDFEFMIGNEVVKLPRKKGCVILFPSYFLHRVTPVTKGTRKSLVLWIYGPPFR